MDLNRKNILKIIFIVFVSALMFVLIQNFQAVLAFLRKVMAVLSPFIAGLAIAFILNVIMRFFENRVFGRLQAKNYRVWNRISRPVCLVLSFVVVSAVVTVLVLLIAPQIRETILAVARDLPVRTEALARSVTGFLERFNLSLDTIDRFDIDWKSISTDIINYFRTGGTTVITNTIDFTSGVVRTIFNLILGFIFSVYLLLSKEKLSSQFKRLLRALFGEKTAEGFFEVAAISNDIFSKFVIGQATEAVILGILCYIGMLIFDMPYAIMISSLVAVTALIPIFGAFIGTAIGALIILLQSPVKALWFVIFIIILQQIESNIIYPRVVGTSVGLPGIWVLFAVTAGGSMFGVIGMLVSVPVCAVLYYLLREYVRGKPDKHRRAF
ncbi:MAG: AI-2E family transporter [Eubacteriales bacterium]|jgi:predicted PurR-regulated permease PerM|nr:AI-2E family transporter [Eubacteriales bacterium]